MSRTFPNPLTDMAPLVKKYGDRNVETVMICISDQRTPDEKQLRVLIPPTPERVGKILDAIHGEFIQKYAQENLALEK